MRETIEARMLRDEELDLASGGFKEVDAVASRRPLSPAEIRGFNPQPDPPGMPLGY